MNIIEDNNNQSPEEFYTTLKERLDAVYEFPDNYLFKFIIPNDHSKMTDIYKVFDGIHNTTTTHESKNGKYVSVNLQAFVLDADQVVKVYKEVSKIEGVLML